MALDGVEQDPLHHPEGDALTHSLQVFDAALEDTDDGELLAAALLHDVGKAIQNRGHARIGAHLLSGLLPRRSVWLIQHHMDLLYSPGRTRRRWRGTTRLAELERLRAWDLAGRDSDALVMTPQDAVDMLLDHLQRSDMTALPYAQESS